MSDGWRFAWFVVGVLGMIGSVVALVIDVRSRGITLDEWIDTTRARQWVDFGHWFIAFGVFALIARAAVGSLDDKQ